MDTKSLVRPSRDGDQFHYLWAARQCLMLLPGQSDLVAVTIEGASTAEDPNSDIEAGDELIDVGLYHGSEDRAQARLIRYVQLKHSTRRAESAWTVSALRKTIRGFADRFAALLERHNPSEVIARFRFEFATNRPIDRSLEEALDDLRMQRPARNANIEKTLLRYTKLPKDRATLFFKAFYASSSEKAMWEQQLLLHSDVSAYLPGADADAPVQLKDLVTRKATTEFESQPSIRRHDVLRALKVSEEDLQPAPCLIGGVENTFSRDQEEEILEDLLSQGTPLLLHADGGVGKTMLAARIAKSIPAGCETVLYDCYGDGLYRNSLHFRHRHRDALVQIANELASRGLCHPLIPTVEADAKMYMRAFFGRLEQAVRSVRARRPEALVCIVIDAADNAEIAAAEAGDSSAFTRDLLNVPLPDGVRLLLTCRSHRRELLKAPPATRCVELQPFSRRETERNLRQSFPEASQNEVSEFAFLSSANPRVQALALSRGLSLVETLKQLGPTATTVDRAMGDLLANAVAGLRHVAGETEAAQLDAICRALAVLRPLIPISLLAKLARTTESAVRTFALDLGRPLLVRGDGLHFVDETSETWFRDRYQPERNALLQFIDLLRPLAIESAYAAALLPQLLLQADLLDEVVLLALKSSDLPADSPLDRRDVELQRLTFAIKACLKQGRHLDAVKLSLKAAGESAGAERQSALMQANTDVIARTMESNRLEQIVSRRTFDGIWSGAHHLYNAGLLAGRTECHPEAASHLRMALDWLRVWASQPADEREREPVSGADRAEFGLAILRLHGSHAAAKFLRRWKWRYYSLDAGVRIGQRLIDAGLVNELGELAVAAGNNVWLVLGLATVARRSGYTIPQSALARTLRLLGDRRTRLDEAHSATHNWTVLDGVRSVIELACLSIHRSDAVWAEILRRYLPETPPQDLSSRFESGREPLLRAYALEAVLQKRTLDIKEVAPPKIREELEAPTSYGRSAETETFLLKCGALLPWVILSAETTCGVQPVDLQASIERSVAATVGSVRKGYDSETSAIELSGTEWLRVLCDSAAVGKSEVSAFLSWFDANARSFGIHSLVKMCQRAAHAPGFESFAIDTCGRARQHLEASREHADTQTETYIELARAVFPVSSAEAKALLDRAVEISSRIGEENLSRWSSLLTLAERCGSQANPRPEAAYRLSRAAELTYEYVAKDKYFDWDRTVQALSRLCASSSVAIVSRWRDRRFGRSPRLIPILIDCLEDEGVLDKRVRVVFAGLRAQWERVKDLEEVINCEGDPQARAVRARIAYQYIRLQDEIDQPWSKLSELEAASGTQFRDVDRLVAVRGASEAREETSASSFPQSGGDAERVRQDFERAFARIDWTNLASLRVEFERLYTISPFDAFSGFIKTAFEKVAVGQQAELVKILADWPDFGLFELRSLIDALPVPLPNQLSLRASVRYAVIAFCRREPSRVQRSGWGAIIPFDRLDREGVVSDLDVVIATQEGFLGQLGSLSASDLFSLSSIVSARLTPDEADVALSFGLDLLEPIMEPDDGDGPFNASLLPPTDVTQALAGYVWAGLGSPIQAERWEYAHVVRAAVEVGWSSFIDSLAAFAYAINPGPFVDKRFDFYLWHARQWLAVGLARGGMSNASELGRVASLLTKMSYENHVIIRALAAQALRTIAANGEESSRDLDELSLINETKLPSTPYSLKLDRASVDAESPRKHSSDDDHYFRFDFTPYWFGPLGRAFGMSEEAVERRALRVVREHLGRIDANGWSADPRRRAGVFDDQETYHSHGQLPKTDDLMAYHGYHSTMMVAADLLRERPVQRHPDEASDEFQQWLATHLLTSVDGLWLFDRRDPRLIMPSEAAEMQGFENWQWSVTAKYLKQQLVSDDGRTVVWGSWNNSTFSRSESVQVRSALVHRDGASALLASLQTAPDLSIHHLPDAGADDEIDCGTFLLFGWVTDDSVTSRLDDGDPWSSGLSYPGPRPSSDIITRLGLLSTDDGRVFASGADEFARTETWTQMQGLGAEEEAVPGRRMCVSQRFIRRLLSGFPDCCLIFAVEIVRHSSNHERGLSWREMRLQRSVRYYLMEGDCVARPLYGDS